ncbi:hypothetical protein R1sor_017969 [Riccia sorocarpa]|uniref:XS domain-containing protein n=1 Tax=Riccia sorocarpa TaxID=122646 RepID=A0ABD3I8H6_9MARC
MSDDEDFHGEYSEDDFDSIEEESLKLLESKKAVVENADGTLRCPFSPNRKKQSYLYKDLMQHAEGVANGKRGTEPAGRHSALAKYLKTHLSAKASPPVQRVHKLDLAAPQRKDDMDLLVWPWCGVVYNIDNSKRCETGKRVGIGNSEIKDYFKVFNPENASVCWGPSGHMGLAVVFFRRDLIGYKDAQAFEKHFIEAGHGRRDWELANQRRHMGTGLYGWLARKEDYEGRKEIQNDWLLTKILKESGDLKDVVMLVQELTSMHEQRVRNLRDTLTAKNEDFEILLHEVEVARRRADFIKEELGKRHKRELEQVKRAAQESTVRHARVMQEHNVKLQASMELFRRKCKELEEMEQQNQVDKSRLDVQKEENQRHLDMINQQSEKQRKYQAHQVMLIQKHEEESKDLAQVIQRMTLRLAAKQQAEIERQHMEEIEESKKFAELAESFEPAALASGNAEELARELKEVRRKLAEFEEQMQSLTEELETGHTTITSLSNKERAATDELEQARKATLEILEEYPEFGAEDGIYVKSMGEIDEAPWFRECKKRYINADWGLVCKTKLSKWTEKIKNPEFHCFKTVQVGQEDEWERKLDENNKDLLALKRQLGEEVHKSVVTALKEIEEWNPSGRYPIRVAWNWKKDRRAALSEIIASLGNAAIAGIKTAPPVKRRRLSGT